MADRPSTTRVVKFIRKGVGVAYVYVEYAKNQSNTTAPTSGWQTTTPAWQNGYYIWERIKTVFSDGTYQYSNPACLSGGKGIASVTEYYLATASSSGVTTSTSGWTTSIQTVTATKKYLWNYEVITYTDNSTTTTTPVIIGTYGDKGVGISSITEYYLATASSSGVTTSTSGWTTSIQTVTATKKYLWNYEVITYTDNSTTTTTPVIIGVYGDKGDQGDKGDKGDKGDQGGQGTRGPALRGPQDWNLCTENGTEAYQFYQGAEGEPYIDFVIYNGYYYVCKKSYASASILPTNSTYWTMTDKVAMIAASVLFADHGFFGDAIISGQWMISANGTINGTTYTKGQTFYSELAYNLFNADSPLGKDISKYESTTASSISSSSATLNKATVTLEAGRVYYLSCLGYTSNTSHPVYVRLIKTDDSSVVVTPISLNTTSAALRTGYAHITQSGTYYIQMYHDTGYTGTMNTCSLVEKCFAPFYALNLRTGKTYQTDIYVSGGVRSPFTYLGQGGTFANDFSDNIAVYSGNASTYALPWTTDQSGRKITITNYYWNGNYSTSTGYAQLTAPSGKYFYEDGVQKSTIKLSREAVELLGYGDASSFYGWIVLKRIDLGTVSRYGHPMKMLAVGRVTGTASGASVSYHSFDGTTLSVTRDDEGVYTLSWNNSSWFASASSVFAMVCGYGTIVSGYNPLYASVKSQTATSITVQTADDDSRNDGAFSFFLMNFDDWIYL